MPAFLISRPTHLLTFFVLISLSLLSPLSLSVPVSFCCSLSFSFSLYIYISLTHTQERADSPSSSLSLTISAHHFGSAIDKYLPAMLRHDAATESVYEERAQSRDNPVTCWSHVGGLKEAKSKLEDTVILPLEQVLVWQLFFFWYRCLHHAKCLVSLSSFSSFVGWLLQATVAVLMFLNIRIFFSRVCGRCVHSMPKRALRCQSQGLLFACLSLAAPKCVCVQQKAV